MQREAWYNAMAVDISSVFVVRTLDTNVISLPPPGKTAMLGMCANVFDAEPLCIGG